MPGSFKGVDRLKIFKLPMAPEVGINFLETKTPERCLVLT